jgi:hypothetical protein
MDLTSEIQKIAAQLDTGQDASQQILTARSKFSDTNRSLAQSPSLLKNALQFCSVINALRQNFDKIAFSQSSFAHNLLTSYRASLKAETKPTVQFLISLLLNTNESTKSL